MGAIEMERATTEDATGIFEDNEIADVLANFGEASGKQSAIGGVSTDEIMHVVGIRQNRSTRAH